MNPRMDDPPVAEYQFQRGAMRGTQFVLQESRLLHFGADSTESTALDAIASVRIFFARDMRRIGWGVAIGIAALILFALSGPLGALAGRGLAEVSAQIARDGAQASTLAQFLESALGTLKLLAGMLPYAALALGIWGAVLGASGWTGSTSLVLVLPSVEREFRVAGHDPLLMEFAEHLSVAVAARLRR